VEMIELDIGMDNNLTAKTRELAVRYFGDDSEESLAQVLEVAFKLRSLWSHSVKQGQSETDEVVSKWEFPESAINRENNASIQNWLFRR
jgi:predicted house-cleaning noncanonical NTP pyrophosphatase (MazG superfamily)